MENPIYPMHFRGLYIAIFGNKHFHWLNHFVFYYYYFILSDFQFGNPNKKKIKHNTNCVMLHYEVGKNPTKT